jgi:hypothetical protein
MTLDTLLTLPPESPMQLAVTPNQGHQGHRPTKKIVVKTRWIRVTTRSSSIRVALLLAL